MWKGPTQYNDTLPCSSLQRRSSIVVNEGWLGKCSVMAIHGGSNGSEARETLVEYAGLHRIDWTVLEAGGIYPDPGYLFVQCKLWTPPLFFCSKRPNC